MDFVLYLGAINEHLLARGFQKLDRRRAREYFNSGLTAEHVENMETVGQEPKNSSDDERGEE
ncbi:hypothetical protein [Methylocystis sp. ATCC 49242]|uniref:hypothetical protein n=1 Tax=Methylocystis sp. ATCC 49242 TaxID=622637 RepID=UPI001185AAB6|nr:hypothetical protein [Methylocystis sp. ATCC 49242]